MENCRQMARAVVGGVLDLRYIPGGVDFLGEGARQRDHIGDAVVFDVGEADLLVHLVQRDPAHRLEMRVQLRDHG